SWYAKEVNAAAAAGLISGYDGFFRPEDSITREEMAVIIVKAYQLRGGKAATGQISRFADGDQVSSWATEAVDQAVSVGLMSGMTYDRFAPGDNATRAQVASLIKRLLEK
ncbi:MAG: S-layer homology domain-containing protein, partial [Clostridia bacterium]|nr:S-layer homology domain-containing protein [Clostridia bacterium]